MKQSLGILKFPASLRGFEKAEAISRNSKFILGNSKFILRNSKFILGILEFCSLLG